MYLLGLTHNGFGNQVIGIEKALWLAIALNRTLVLPPILNHGAFERWPVCGDEKAFTARAVSKYKAAALRDVETRWTRVFDFSIVESAAGRTMVLDFESFPFKDQYVISKEVRCPKTTNLRSREIQALARIHENDHVLVVGSALRHDLTALRNELELTRAKLLEACRVIPFVACFRDVALSVIRNMIVMPFAAVHLRTGDSVSYLSEGVTRYAHVGISVQLQNWMRNNSAVRALYISYDLRHSYELFSNLTLCKTLQCKARDDIFSRKLQISASAAAAKFSNCSQNTSIASLRHAYGRETTQVVLDQEIAAHSKVLLLSATAAKQLLNSAGHKKHGSIGKRLLFRGGRTSTFGVMLRRRWLLYHPPPLSSPERRPGATTL